MLDRLRSREAKVVVAVDLDRLLRDTGDPITVTATGASAQTVHDPIDLTTADGDVRASMLASIARLEVRLKGEGQLRINIARAAAGPPVPTPIRLRPLRRHPSTGRGGHFPTDVRPRRGRRLTSKPQPSLTLASWNGATRTVGGDGHHRARGPPPFSLHPEAHGGLAVDSVLLPCLRVP